MIDYQKIMRAYMMIDEGQAVAKHHRSNPFAPVMSRQAIIA